MRSLSLSGSGQPSASSKPSLSSGSFGHRSSTSRMPSPSLSGSGQPSSSWKPSKSSGSSGHLSTLSGMRSPSRPPTVVVGKPSGGAPGTLWHLSPTSGMPSRSLSGSGQPSSSSKPSKSSGSSGHLSTSSLMPSPSRSPMFGSNTMPMNARRSGFAPLLGTRPRPPPSDRNELRARYSLTPAIASSG